VPTSAYGDLERVRPREVEGPRHVTGAETTHDHGRPAIDQRVEAAARHVEPGVRGHQHGAGKRPPQLGQAVTVTDTGRIDRFTHRTPHLFLKLWARPRDQLPAGW
jgi:hypothetical protein